MNYLLPLALATSLLLAPAVQAKVTFRVGPRAGLNVATFHYYTGFGYGKDATSTYRAGFEAGVQGAVGFGHWVVQPAVIYSQMGHRLQGEENYFSPAHHFTQQVRTTYLTIPLTLARTQHANGQGFQVFAGPYVGILLGGSAQVDDGYGQGPVTGEVKVAYYDQNDGNFYSQRLDWGLQGGVGYRYEGLLLQAGYSLGLRDMTVSYDPRVGAGPFYASRYYNRAFLFSLAYLLGTKGTE